MKHAGPAALDALEPLLAAVRTHEALTERSRGVFYRGSKATLHFHEDPAGMFADLRLARTDREFARFRVSTPDERKTFLHALAGSLG